MSTSLFRKQFESFVHGVRAQMDDLAKQLGALHGERHRLVGAWRPRAEALERLERVVDLAAADYAKRLQSRIVTAARPDTVPAAVHSFFDGSRFDEQFDANSLAYFFGDHIKEKLREAVAAQPWRGLDDDDDGIPVEGRAARIEELDQRIAEIESQRDALRAEIGAVSQQ